MAQATKATEQVGKGTEDAAKRANTAMGRMVQSAQQNREAWNTAGATLTGFGAAALGGLGLATKAAMDWESSWAGVQKTVDGTAPQMAALEQGLRSMARELPASHQEIAAVAEAAGQLGISTPNVLGFTRTMIDMGESTNMSAEEAATSLARFMNVMGTSQTDVGRLGASVVGLGNNFATTESEIVAMSQRLAGAGAQASMTEGDVMGIAAAMSSVGIEAEAGGSAMSQTMKRIGKSVDEGGESLELFAQVSGMSAQEFSAAWKADPAMALEAFITGLSGVEAQGMTTNGVLADLGITGIREADALLRLSAAAGSGADGMSLLAQAVQMGNDEFDKGTALIEEASKRYETAESRIQIAKNALVDAGISIGGVVLPAFANLADGVADVAGWFADLPRPVHETVGALAGIAGAGSLAAGSFLLIFPRVMDTVQAFKTLKADMPGAASGLGKVGKAAGVAAGAFIGLQVLGAVVDHFAEARMTAEEFTASLMNASATTDITAASINDMIAATGTGNAAVTDLGNAFDILDAGGFARFMDQVNAGFGVWDTQTEIAIEQVNKLDQAMSTMFQSGNVEQMSQTFKAAMEASGESAEGLIARLPTLRTALTDVATSMGVAADDATLAKIATGELSPVLDEATGAMGAVEGASGEMAAGMDGATGAVEEQVDALAELQDLLSDTANLLLGVRGSERDFQAAIDDATASVEEHGRTLDRTTEAGRANEAALDSIAEAAHNWANAAEESGASAQELDGIMQAGRDNFIRTAEAMGMSTEEATRLADELQLIPDFVETEVEVETQAAREEFARLWEEQALHPPQIPVTADTQPAEGELAQFHGLVGDKPADVPVGADTGEAERKVNTFGQKVGETPTGDVPIDADTAPAEEQLHIFGSRAGDYSATVIIDADTYYGEDQLRQFQSAVNEAGGTVTINGETLNGEQALAALVQEVNAGQGYVDINGTPVNAEAALLMLVDHINNSGGTVDIDGNKVPAELKTGEVKKQIDGTEGTVTIDGDNAPANAATDSAKRKADGTTGTIDVNANTGGAESSINSTARNRSSTITANAATWSAENQLNWLARNRTSTITVRTSGAGGGVKAQLAYATGGAVHGAGTGTSDSIPAWLSNGEHVITAREVAMAGGQDAIYRMREAIRSGFKFANGGAVEKRGYAPVPTMTPASSLGQRQVSASVDTAAIASAVAGAISGYQPIVQVGDREFVGVMRRAGRMGAR